MLRALQIVFGGLILLCLVILAIRAALRLDDRWDTFMYHLPFAALRGGLGIPYEMNDRIALLFQGWPPLPHLVQGLLWRATGSINATGLANYMALISFIVLCQIRMKAPFYVVTAIALTAPMVLIHASVSYVDLFGNSWLALGTVCLFYAYYFDNKNDRRVLITGLLGLTAAAWSKYQLVPIAALLFLMYACLYRPTSSDLNSDQKKSLYWILIAGFIAALPYLKNWVIYGNPFWPVQFPVLQDLFPYSPAFLTQELASIQGPRPLIGSSQFKLFIHSLFEINHPHEYPHRSRWIIDQGNAWLAFRSGGFWNVSVVTYLLMTTALSIYLKPTKGLMVVLTGLVLLLFVSILPQSHELRYYLFIPLTWAGIIGALYMQLSQRHPRLAMMVLTSIIGLFLYVSTINSSYYKVERIGFSEIAAKWGADRWWSILQPDQRYCVVDKVPMGMMMTGPTMTEYYIIDRTLSELCPEGSIHIGGQHEADELPNGMMTKALELIYTQLNYSEAIIQLDKILLSNPTHFGAMWQRATALERSGRIDEAIRQWSIVIEVAKRKSYTDLDVAQSRLAALQALNQGQLDRL